MIFRLLLHLLGYVDQAFVLVSYTLGHDAVVEVDVGVSAVLLADFEALRCLVGYVQAF